MHLNRQKNALNVNFVKNFNKRKNDFKVLSK